MDYRKLFDRTLFEEINKVFEAHGIEYIHEEELESLVIEADRKCYYPSIAKFRQEFVAEPAVPKIRLW